MTKKNNDIKIEQLCNLIGLESKFSPKTVRTVLDAFYKVILKQLELNQRIYLLDFGAFEVYERPSGDKVMGDFENGGTIVRYVAPRNKIVFKPSDSLDNAINEGGYVVPTRKKKGAKSRRQIIKEYNERHKKDKPTTEELLVKALNVSQARQENDDFKVRRAKR